MAITQQCLLSGADGYKSVLMAFRVLIAEHPSLRAGCCAIVTHMSLLPSPLCPPRAAEIFSDESETTGAPPSAASLFRELDLPKFCGEALHRCVIIATHAAELIEKNVFFDSNEESIRACQELCQCSNVALQVSSLSAQKVTSLLAALLYNLCSSFASASFSLVCPEKNMANCTRKTDWRRWLSNLFARLVLDNELMEAAFCALASDIISLPSHHTSSEAITGLDIFLSFCNEQVNSLLLLLTKVLNIFTSFVAMDIYIF